MNRLPITHFVGAALMLGATSCSERATDPGGAITMTVSLAASALLTGTTTRATATLRDGNAVLTGRPVAWSTDNADVATVSASGVVSGVATGTAHIVASSEGTSGSALVTVSALPPYNGSAEPAGMTAISERPFTTTVEDGWTLPAWAGPYFTTVQDPTAPKSPVSVAQVRFPSGWIGGDSPALEEKALSGNATTLYVSLWMKLSPNWIGHPTGTNKVIHLWINGINRMFASVDGSDADVLTPRIGLQQLAGAYDDGFEEVATGVDLRPNVVGQTGVQIVRGRWHRWEIILRSNTNGDANGSVDWWLDGALVGHYTGIQYVAAGASNTWDIIKFDPTWGGLGGTLPADQFIYMDHLYISGKH